MKPYKRSFKYMSTTKAFLISILTNLIMMIIFASIASFFYFGVIKNDNYVTLNATISDVDSFEKEAYVMFVNPKTGDAEVKKLDSYSSFYAEGNQVIIYYNVNNDNVFEKHSTIILSSVFGGISCINLLTCLIVFIILLYNLKKKSLMKTGIKKEAIITKVEDITKFKYSDFKAKLIHLKTNDQKEYTFKYYGYENLESDKKKAVYIYLSRDNDSYYIDKESIHDFEDILEVF